ncbi:MAG: glycosyltransferase family 9 protein, partial [Gammaproteobacteria bacterium]
QHPEITQLVLFTHQPELFARCPYVDQVHSIADETARSGYGDALTLFDTAKLPYHLMDTFDFMSIPAGLGQLSFREKRLEYFPGEDDQAERFDVVLNTSMTWPSRSWPIASWQRLANELLTRGKSVAVVGKTVYSPWDQMAKTSEGLRGCVDLTNRLSLDQTYFTIARAGLFVTCQNGLSVLSGATETQIVVLDRSIEWSKYAIYRHEDPHYRFTLVKGNCDIYCCDSEACPVYGEFRCIPGFDAVWTAVSTLLDPA